MTKFFFNTKSLEQYLPNNIPRYLLFNDIPYSLYLADKSSYLSGKTVTICFRKKWKLFPLIGTETATGPYTSQKMTSTVSSVKKGQSLKYLIARGGIAFTGSYWYRTCIYLQSFKLSFSYQDLDLKQIFWICIQIGQ